MAALSGQSGSFKWETSGVALITSWDLTLDDAQTETTSFTSSGYREYASVGLKSGTVSIAGFLDSTKGVPLTLGTTGTVDLYIDGTHYYSGEGIVKSIKVSSKSTDLIGFTADIQYTGTITPPSFA